MKKLLSITTAVLISNINSSSFAMQTDGQEAQCYGWLTHFCAPQNSANYQPLSTPQITQPITPIQAYNKTILEQTTTLIKSNDYYDLADLVATVHNARENHNIQALELGRFIFQQQKEKSRAHLASLIVLRINHYLEAIKTTNTPQLTTAQININKQTKTKTGDPVQNSRHILNIIGINKQKQEVSPIIQLGVDIAILISHRKDLHAETIYNINPTTNTTVPQSDSTT